VISFVGTLIIRALHATLRVRHVRVERLEALPQSIIAFWHDHLLLMLHSRYPRPISVMISQSKDGELIAGALKYYGAVAVRGSSTRGGSAALREIIRAGRAGMNLAFTPDGPKGPARIAKDGVVYAAQATGLPIVPIVFAAKKKSYCTPGTGWSCRTRSRRRSSCTAIRSSCRVTGTSRSGESKSNRR
jgi:lysophospholipid acyltransferase (LPLAT)-like uncharacterized protein